MNFTGNIKRVILLYTGMPDTSVDETVNVILTPQFYTLKREVLPIKYSYQAKKIAPSLFDGLLEENGEYDYFVSKKDGEWEFIAYDLEKIKNFLQSKGIDPQKVSRLYFAQQLADTLTSPVALGEDEAMANINDTMAVVPRSVLSEAEDFKQPDTFSLPKKGISLGGEGSLLTRKQALSLAAVLLLFAAIFVYEGLRYGGNAKEESAQMQTLLAEYPALQSRYTRESVAQKYQTLDTHERRKREVIKALSKMIFKGVTLTSLRIDDRKFQAEFAVEDNKVAQKLKALAKKEKFNTSNVKSSHTIRIEGQL